MHFANLYADDLPSARGPVSETFDALFDWHYGAEKQELLGLYTKGKRKQWDADERIDWSLEIDHDNPQGLPEEIFPLFGSDIWAKLTQKEKADLRRHYQSWTVSQFLHGEQGALFCASKIVQQVPDMEAKFYGATQVMDEARHVEAYRRLIEKYGITYSISGPLDTLLKQVLSDNRWDMTYLGMQVVIEGLALAAFAMVRDHSNNPLTKAVNAYVMEDEARHVAFGRLSLRDYYPQLTEAERKEREEFLVEACYLMRDRFRAEQVWEHMGFDVKACVDFIEQSQVMQIFRTNLFTRIVPVVKDIGLWGDKVQKAYADMGVLGFADLDITALQNRDEQIAEEMDARRAYVEGVIAGEQERPAAAE